MVSTEVTTLLVAGEFEERPSVLDVEMVSASELVEIASPCVDLLVVVLAVDVV